MKAIILNGFGGTDQFSVADLPLPAVQNDEVLIQLKASGFNPIDYQMRLGLRESELMNSPVMGIELSGIVINAGANTKGFKKGDEVMALCGTDGSNGSYAQFMTLNYLFLAHKPANISFEAAAAVPTSGSTAFLCFANMTKRNQSSVFINGAAGGVGRFLISLLKAAGWNNIVATAGNEQSTAALLDLGLLPSQVINYRHPDFEQDILKANANQQFDYAIDLVGGEIAETAARLLKTEGTYLDITFLGTPKTREMLFDKGCTIINISGYAHALEGNFAWYGETLYQLAELIAQEKIQPPFVNIIGELNLKTVQEAHRLMETNQINGKKLIMSI